MNVDIPTDVHENIVWRAKLLGRCANDPSFAAAVKKLFQEDIMFAFRAFFYTYDPRPNVVTHNLPFLPYDFQEDVIRQLMFRVETGRDLAILKSRDMGLTWVIVTVFLHYWLRNQPGFDFLLGSRKEDYVDKRGDPNTLFQKLRYNLYNMPEFILPVGFTAAKHDTHMTLVNPESGSIIRGEANNADFGTGARYTAGFVDEFAKWRNTDAEAWTSLGDTTPCRIAVSTPRGRGNKFADLILGEDGSEIDIIKLPWELHPKKDMEWYKKEEKRRSPLEIAQELDMSFEGSAGEVFFQDYNARLHKVEDNSIIPGRDVLVGFDFGYIHPAVVTTQVDDQDRWVIQRCILGANVDIKTFANYVWKRLDMWYPASDFLFYVDIAGAQVSDKGPKTSISILRDIVDGPIIYKKVNREAINTKMRDMLNTNKAGLPSILLQDYKNPEGYILPKFIAREDTGYLHEGFVGGIHYPKSKVIKEDWDKEGYFEHGFDALGFIIQNMFLSARSPSRRLDMRRKINDQNEKLLNRRSGAYGGRFNLSRHRKAEPRFGNVQRKRKLY